MIVPRFVSSISLATAVFGFVRSLFLAETVSSDYARLIRKFFDKQHVILFPQARIALYAVVRAILPKDPEIIISAYNVPVVIEYLEAAGARLKYVDIEEDGFNMDVGKAIEAIGENTRAVVVSHMYGKSVDFARLIPICKKKGILIIEDAAQAFGSLLDSSNPGIAGALCGTVGDVGVFSTGILKKFSTVIGGYIVTDDGELAGKLRNFKYEHRKSGPAGIPIANELIEGVKFIVVTNRFLFPLIFSLFKDSIRKINERDEKKQDVIDPDSLPCALFERYHSWLGIRSFRAHERNNAPFVVNAELLDKRFGRTSTCAYLHYPVIVHDRSEAIKEINEAGYDVGPGKFFNYGNELCPRAETAVKNNLNIPIHRLVTRAGLDRIADIIETHQTESPSQ